jgi:hypothetical protein
MNVCYHLLYARVGVGSDLQVSNLLDFKGSEALGNCIPHFLWHSTYSFLLIYVCTIKIICIKLCCLVMNKRNHCHTVLCTSVLDRELNWSLVTKMMYCTVLLLRLGVCQSWVAVKLVTVLAILRQKLPPLFCNLFTRCWPCLWVEGHLQHLF